MPLILPGNVGSATAATGFNVANSLRFNDDDSPYMVQAVGTPTDIDKVTFSTWVKLSGTTTMTFLGCHYDTNNRTFFQILADGDVKFLIKEGGTDIAQLITDRKLRDVSAWFHLVIAIDTTQSTDTNRIKLYINGVQETSFSTATYLDQNTDLRIQTNGQTSNVGRLAATGNHIDGYLAETVLIDGQQLAADQFGEFDEDSPTIWKPKDVSGLTFGDNGFYLEYKETGTSQNSSGIGADTSGNTNHLSVSGLAATDQATDTPTNNFATINPLDNFYANATLSEGNLKMVSGSSRECSSTATIALSNGKWFWEYEVTTFSAPFGGIQPIPSFGNTASAAVLQTNGLGYLKTGKVETTDGSGGSTELASDYATYAVNDIIGVALDLDASTNIIYFYKNGALQGSGVNLTHVDSTANRHYLIAFGAVSGQDTFEINFGNPITALDSANADANGYGAFEFAVPSGFFSICTKNLAEYG